VRGRLPLGLGCVGLLAAGCTYKVAAFAGDLADALCARYAECELLNAGGYDDEAVCTAAEESAALEGSSCGEAFDPEAARACVEAWEATTCDELREPGGAPACAGVCPEDAGSDSAGD
jgi:hypothetical protein